MAIAHRATGTAVFSAATMAPAIPAAQTVGDMMLLLVGGKPYNASLSVEGWTFLGMFTDGSTGAGVDTGSMFVTAWFKECLNDVETDPSIVEGGTAWDVVGGLVMVFSKATTEQWEVPVIVGGGDATAGTGFSVTAGSNPGITAGDACVSFAAFRSDAATPCSSHLVATATSATFTNTHDPGTDPESTTGGDMGMCVNRATLTGTASAAPVMAATLAASHTGSAAFIRLRVAAMVGQPLEPMQLRQLLAH